VFIEAKDDGGGGDNWTTAAISRAKLQKNHHHQQTNIQFFYRLNALPVTQPTVSKHLRESITFDVLAYPKLTWGSSNFVSDQWPLIAPGYLGEGLPCLSSALWCQHPMADIIYINYHGSLELHPSHFEYFNSSCWLGGRKSYRWCKSWWQLELQSCKAPVKSSPPTNQPTPNFLQAGCPSCHPTNSVKALKEKTFRNKLRMRNNGSTS